MYSYKLSFIIKSCIYTYLELLLIITKAKDFT